MTRQTQEDSAGVDLIALDPRQVRLYRSGIPDDVTVRATVEDPVVGGPRSWPRVKLARAFPFSAPDQYIGLRDDHDRDIGVLLSLDGMDAESRRVLDEEMERRYFLPAIRRVLNVKEEGAMSTWEVETDRGRHTFIVQNIRDSVHEVTTGRRVLLTDIRGIRYDIPDVTTLDGRAYGIVSRAL